MNADFNQVRDKVTESFKKQTIMATLGATIESVEPGEVIIHLPFKEGLSQQDGFIHAGVITTIVDSACGYAAMTLMPEDARVLTIEFKSNFASPAIGDVFIAKGRVIKPGRNVMITSGEVHAKKSGGEQDKLISLMQATMMVLKP